MTEDEAHEISIPAETEPSVVPLPPAPAEDPGMVAAAEPLPPPVSETQFLPLDPRVIRLWRLTRSIGFGILLLAAGIFGVAMGATAMEPMWGWIGGAWLVFAALAAWLAWWRPARLYRSWGWRLDSRVLEIRRGLLFRVVQLLPLSRLQHVDLHRGPLERYFGLATLLLHTAGTHAATIAIPGLAADEAVRLRDHLIEVGGDDAV